MKIFGTTRPFALFAIVAVIVAAVAFLFDSSIRSPDTASALTATAGVSCADVYQDIGNDTPLGSPPDGNDIPAASSMNRIEPSQTAGAGFYDLTTVTYLGPDLAPGDEADVGLVPGDAIPDIIPTSVLCGAAATAANAGVEANTMVPQHTPGNQYNDRPSTIARLGTYDATNAEGGGTCADGLDNDGDSGVAPAAGLTVVSFDELDEDCYDYPGTPHRHLRPHHQQGRQGHQQRQGRPRAGHVRAGRLH
jgi:hypothetical protein